MNQLPWLQRELWGHTHAQWIAVAIIAVALAALLYYLSKNLPF